MLTLSKFTCGQAYEKTELMKISKQQHKRLSKLVESRKKAALEIKRIHQQIDDAVQIGNRRVRVKRLVTNCEDAMTKAIKRHNQLLELTLKVDDCASLLNEQQTWLNVLTTTNDKVLKRARQFIDSLPATDKTSQSSYKTSGKIASFRSGNSITSKSSSQRQKELLIAKHCREEFECQHEMALRLAKQQRRDRTPKVQQEQQRLPLEAEHLHQDRLQRLQEQEQQLLFEEQRTRKGQLLDVLETEKEAERRVAVIKLAKIQLTEELPESTEEKEFKDTLSQLRATSRGVESWRVTDCVHNSSVNENSNKCQLKVFVADPNACTAVHPAPMCISFPVNPEGVIINCANFDDVTRDPTSLFQQQSCPAVISPSLLVVTSRFDNTATAPPPFDASLVVSKRFVENCSSNPFQAVPLHVLPNLQPITTVTTSGTRTISSTD